MRKLLVFLAAVALCSCGCHTAKNAAKEKNSTAKPEKETSAPAHSLTNTKWILTRIGGQPVMDSPETPYIVFAGSQVSGCLGCNTFFGTFYASKKGHLDLDYSGATKRLCSDMNVENQFMSALRAEKKSYQIKGNILIISGEKLTEDGTVKQVELLQFKVEE